MTENRVLSPVPLQGSHDCGIRGRTRVNLLIFPAQIDGNSFDALKQTWTVVRGQDQETSRFQHPKNFLQQFSWFLQVFNNLRADGQMLSLVLQRETLDERMPVILKIDLARN